MTDDYDFLENGTWEIVDSYFKQLKSHQIVRHQLESFNDFMSNKIPKIVQQYNPISILADYNVDVGKYKYELKISFSNIAYSKPVIYENNGSTQPMYPNEARLRNFSYSSQFFIDINIETLVRKGKNLSQVDTFSKKLEHIAIGKIPIMLQSKYCLLSELSNKKISDYGECELDYGGYFIINGNEKVLVSQERMSSDKIYVFPNAKQCSKYSHLAEIKSSTPGKFLSTKGVSIKLTRKEGLYGRTIKITIPYVRQDLPVCIVLKALGLESDLDIIEKIVLDPEKEDSIEIISLLKPSIDEASDIKTQEDALEYISKYVHTNNNPKDFKIEKEKKIASVKELLKNDYLPHIGENIINKQYFTGYMINKLLNSFIGRIEFDDRDSYVNKRIDSPGILLASLFRQYFTKLIKDMRNSVMKELNSGSWKATNNVNDIINISNIYKILKSTTIDSGLRYALATGNWGLKTATNKQGIAQVLSRLTYNGTLSHLRRVNTPIEKTGKLILPRKLHNTQWGIICPAETPEGGPIGVVKNLAITAHITTEYNIAPVLQILNETIIYLGNIKTKDLYDKVKIFVNGNWLGIHDNPEYIVTHLRSARRKGLINPFISIAWYIQLNEIHIFSDAGRACRPLYIVDNNKLRVTEDDINKLEKKQYRWNNLIVGSLNQVNLKEKKNYQPNNIKEGIIEYIDTEESNTLLVAMNQNYLKGNSLQRYTHCEIHPSLILGVLASCIPFPDHNQSPRNTYQAAMGKQAMGVYTTNYKARLDTMAHILNYPQKSLISTRIMRYFHNDSIPNGLNAIVAIATYSGYNQEDSIIMNKSSIDRGLFRSTFFRTYKDEEKRNQSSGEEEKFCKPNLKETQGMRLNSYEKLDDNGFVKVNTFVENGDMVIGKIIPLKTSIDDKKKYRDNSTQIRNNESGFIDKVYINRNGDGYRFCKVRIRNERSPTIGDKFSSRHGQKGTVGMIYPEKNMPFTTNGLVPDLIINPHAIPSRMTIAQLIECIMGKAGVTLGLSGDATPFNSLKTNDVCELLEKCGINRFGNETMYNGLTGQRMNVQIFMGPTYYQRLKHMVNDKIHSRASGPVVLLTRQPAEGRSRDGGLRFGEMERDCIISHGGSHFLKERMLDVSDNYRVFLCRICGLTSVVNTNKNIYCCSNCKNYNNFSEIHLPYACKLFIQELESMSIAPRIITD